MNNSSFTPKELRDLYKFLQVYPSVYQSPELHWGMSETTYRLGSLEITYDTGDYIDYESTHPIVSMHYVEMVEKPLTWAQRFTQKETELVERKTLITNAHQDGPWWAYIRREMENPLPMTKISSESTPLPSIEDLRVSALLEIENKMPRHLRLV